jgi:hypothetical protein
LGDVHCMCRVRNHASLIPTGAAVTAVRDLAYFRDAAAWGPLLVLAVWGVAGAAVSVLAGGRGTAAPEAQGALAATAAP